MSEIDRRGFLGHDGGGRIGGPSVGAASIPQVGMQLYTVRTELEKDFAGTLAKVAAIGYKEVEFAGYFNHTPQQVRSSQTPRPDVAVRARGLRQPGRRQVAGGPGGGAHHRSHVPGQPLDRPVVRSEPGIWKRVAETFNRAGEASKKAGIQFAYHNHNFEFAPVDGQAALRRCCSKSAIPRSSRWSWISAGSRRRGRIRSSTSSGIRVVSRWCTSKGCRRSRATAPRCRSTSSCRSSRTSAATM